MSDQVVSALASLMDRWMAYQQQRMGGAFCQATEEWLSPCLGVTPQAGWQRWYPVRRSTAAVMDNLSVALEMTVHPDLAAFYGHWYSSCLLCSFKGLRVALIQPWNDADYEHLQENLIGHALMQRRLRLAPTFFLASTRHDAFIISLDNQTGEVLFEHLGHPARTVLAPNLVSFLQRLEPLPEPATSTTTAI